MKKSIFAIALFTIVALFSNDVVAQKFRPLDKSPLDVAGFPNKGAKVVKVTYSRPQLKGRSVSTLAPNDKVWRTGANEAVEIRFYEDVTFGGKSVKAGVYSLYTIPGEKEWTIILSSDVDAWGAYSYNKANDIVRVKGKVTQAENSLEAFSMTFDKKMNLHMGWDKLRVKVALKK
ncbi:DUF2911 domain-containing protein [Bacteroidota bacterium]